MSKKIPLSVVTIAHNEEKNIEACLGSTMDWTDEHIMNEYGKRNFMLKSKMDI